MAAQAAADAAADAACCWLLPRRPSRRPRRWMRWWTRPPRRPTPATAQSGPEETDDPHRAGAAQRRRSGAHGHAPDDGREPAPRRGQRKAEAGAAGRSSAGRTAAPPVPPRVRSEGRGLRMSSPDRRARGLALVVCVVASLYGGQAVPDPGAGVDGPGQAGPRPAAADLPAARPPRRRRRPRRAGPGLHGRAAARHRRPDPGRDLRRPRRPPPGRAPRRGGQARPGPRHGRRDADRAPRRRPPVRLRRQGHPARGVARGRRAARSSGVFSEQASRRTYPAGPGRRRRGRVRRRRGPRPGRAGDEPGRRSCPARTATCSYEVSGESRSARPIPGGATEEKEPVDGDDVVLTLDRDLQWMAEDAARRGRPDLRARSPPPPSP